MSALREAAALADKLEKLNRKYDAKIRKLESKFGNAKLDVSSWLSAERERLLSAADPEVRRLVEQAEGES